MSHIAPLSTTLDKLYDQLVIDLQDFVGVNGDVVIKDDKERDFVEVICEEHSIDIEVFDIAAIKVDSKENDDSAALLEDFTDEELDSAYVVEYTKVNFFTNFEEDNTFSAQSYYEIVAELKEIAK